MSHYIVELIVWTLIAYIIGCIIGWLLRSLFGGAAVETVETASAPVQPAAPSVAPAPAAPVAAVAPVPPAPAAAPVAAAPPAPPKPIEPEILSPVPLSAVPGAIRMERPRGLEAPRDGSADNLQMMSGVGPKNEQVLHNLGFYHFDQIAGWTPQQVAWVDDHLKFGGRIEREEWIAQAKLLANGDYAEFYKRYDTGGMSEAEFLQAMAPKSAAPPAAAGGRSKPQGLATPRGGKADNLQRISGVGPKNEKILHSLGVFHFEQIAAWTKQEIAWVDEHLKFNGRIEREEWVTQCQLLAAGKEAEFAKRWGTGGIKPEKK